ncbi:MAG: hypothetical protein QOF36_619 [Microbacteriaceae bacterium]|jgi:hypothetical protein|nr:hypothetical protein [Microbacteriaceae bacterium]
MRTRIQFSSAIALSGVLLGSVLIAAPAAPAAAATGVTLTVVGGALSITVPATANLGTWTNTVAGGTLSTALGQVQVNDARSPAAGSGWVATVISTALTPSSGPTIAAALMGYTAGPIVKVGTATYVANNPATLEGVVAAVTASGITGDNSATWNPTINVHIPGGTLAGDYTGTITHSVS